MPSISFEVPGRPQPQGSMRNIGRGRMISDNPKLKSWRDAVAIVALLAKERTHYKPLIKGAVSIYAEFYFLCPKSVREQENTRKPDIDKLIRAIFDALTGVVYVDDSQVNMVSASKHFSYREHAVIRVVWRP